MLEVMKEYLVSLGFKVDTSSLNSAQKAMRQAEDMVGKFSSSSVTNFAKASTGVIALVATANLAIAKFVGGLAQASLENEIFARKMWMNVDSARAYTSSINALGVSLQDLYLSPELMQKYLELNNLAKDMAVPGYDKAMLGVRDITFEFQKLKLEGTYALQWIEFYLTKILAGPMGDFKKALATMNDSMQKNMPKWTEKVAMVVSWFVRLGLAAWKVRDGIGAIMLVFTAFKAIKMLTNPFALMMLGLTALLLLIDDFSTYERGGQSAWKWIDKLGDSLKGSGLGIADFKKDIDGVLKSVGDLGVSFGDLFKVLKDAGAGDLASKALTASLTILDGLLKGMAKSVSLIAGGLQGLTTGDWSKFNQSTDFFNDPMKGYRDNLKKQWGVPDTTPGPVPNKALPDQPAAPGLWDQLKGIFNFFKNGPDDYRNQFKTGDPAQTSFKKMQKGIEQMAALMSYHSSVATGTGNSSPGLGYLYPQSSQSSGITQITMSPVYHITSTDPSGVATQINRNNTSLITRTVQGVIR